MTDFLLKHWIEIFAVVTGLLYVYLEIEQKKAMWIVGIISSAIFVYVYFGAKFYASMIESGYYVIISVYGYFKWNGELKPEIGKSKIKNQKSKILTFISVGLILSAILGWTLKNFTDSPVPYFDGLKVAFGVVATWMVTQKIIQHWYFWMGINIFCVPLYASQGLYFTAFMFFVYFIMSIIGLQKWKKDLIKEP